VHNVGTYRQYPARKTSCSHSRSPSGVLVAGEFTVYKRAGTTALSAHPAKNLILFSHLDGRGVLQHQGREPMITLKTHRPVPDPREPKPAAGGPGPSRPIIWIVIAGSSRSVQPARSSPGISGRRECPGGKAAAWRQGLIGAPGPSCPPLSRNMFSVNFPYGLGTVPGRRSQLTEIIGVPNRIRTGVAAVKGMSRS
jgi:hypothetical protein